MAALIFGGFVILIEVIVMLKRGRGWGTDSVRIVGLTLVIIVAMFLATSTISAERLSAAYALLGTIAGYFIGNIGKLSSTTPPTKKESEES